MQSWEYTKKEVEEQRAELADHMDPSKMARELIRAGVLSYFDYQAIMEPLERSKKNEKLLDSLLQYCDYEYVYPALTQSLRLLYPALADELRPAPPCVLWFVSSPPLAAHVVHCLPCPVAFHERVEIGAGYLFRQAFLTVEQTKGEDSNVLLYIVFPYDPKMAPKAFEAALQRFEPRSLVVMSGICTRDRDAGSVIVTVTSPEAQDEDETPQTQYRDKVVKIKAYVDQAVKSKACVLNSNPMKPTEREKTPEWEKSVMVKVEGVVTKTSDIDTAMSNSTNLLHKIIFSTF